MVRPRNRVRYRRAAPSTSGPFIGRDAELEAFSQAFADVLERSA